MEATTGHGGSLRSSSTCCQRPVPVFKLNLWGKKRKGHGVWIYLFLKSSGAELSIKGNFLVSECCGTFHSAVNHPLRPILHCFFNGSHPGWSVTEIPKGRVVLIPFKNSPIE